MEKINIKSLPKPLQLLSQLNEDIMMNHLHSKQEALAGGNLSEKTKALLLLSAAVALDSESCIMNNVKLSKNNGATKEEILETFAIAKFAKSATTISKAAVAFEWLLENI